MDLQLAQRFSGLQFIKKRLIGGGEIAAETINDGDLDVVDQQTWDEEVDDSRQSESRGTRWSTTIMSLMTMRKQLV